MWIDDQKNRGVWNALGLVSTNGTVVMSLELFERALQLAREQVTKRPAPTQGPRS